MRSLSEFRSGKPDFYPDQSVYAEYACAEFGLAFQDIDGGSGLLFRVASSKSSVHFGAGRCSWYPQNNATAATLASDKYFTNRILEDAGVATLGGEYFFLHERRRSHRAPGHERETHFVYLKELGGTAFAKPLLGSRGDFAQDHWRRGAACGIFGRGFAILRFDIDPADGDRKRIPDFAARRRGHVLRQKISAVCVGRWRALDRRSVDCA